MSFFKQIYLLLVLGTHPTKIFRQFLGWFWPLFASAQTPLPVRKVSLTCRGSINLRILSLQVEVENRLKSTKKLAETF